MVVRGAGAAGRISADHEYISYTVSCSSDQSTKHRAVLAGRLLDTMKG